TGNRTYTANWEADSQQPTGPTGPTDPTGPTGPTGPTDPQPPAAQTYNITYVLNGGTNATDNPSKYTAGTVVTLKAPTKTGYTFKGWTGSNGTTPEINVTISVSTTGDKSYTANWEEDSQEAQTYNITYILNGGINASDNPTEYTTGTAVTLKAPTKTGYTFKGWSGSNGSVPEKNVTISASETGDKNYSANWEADGSVVEEPFIITASAGTGGSISPSGSLSVEKGKWKMFRIKADSGYSISEVLVDGKSVGAVGYYTFSNIDANHSIKATFAAEKPKTVEVQKITPSKSQVSLVVGKTETVYASVTPSNATNKQLAWSTGKSSVATVSNGIIRGVGAGETTISVEAQDGSGVKASVKVKVTKQSQTISGTKSYRKNATDKAFSLDAKRTKGDGTLTYASSNKSVATVTSSGKVHLVGVGKTVITVKAAATIAYNAASYSVEVVVVPGATSSIKASNQASGIKVSWTKVTQVTGYYLYRNGNRIKTIAKGSTISYSDSQAKTNGEKYTYKVVAYASTGASTLSKSTSLYRLSGTGISSLKNSSKGKMTIKWKKNAKASGYQVQYSTSASFNSGVKSITIKKNGTTSATVSNLKKKTYYVRMRGYKTVGKSTEYSAWSGTKKLKITK
ncbi:MAG: InlB B-repeat-containing protein, partial [Lachnospiraceae bacterium]|nr:InlB B-repeat-containing protein [Lachnospiraceae bacterium]